MRRKKNKGDELVSASSVAASDVLHARGVKRRLLLVGLPIVIILAGASVAGYLLVHKKAVDTDGVDNRNPGVLGVDYGDKIDRLYRQADTAQANGDYADVKGFFQEALAFAKTNEDKARVYRHFSSVALNQGAYDDALQYSQETEKLNPTQDTAMLVAQSAVGKGDKAMAIEYYQKAIDRISPAADDELGQSTVKYYQQRIAELQQ